MFYYSRNWKTKFIYGGFDNEGWNIESGYPENPDTYRTYPNRTRDGVKLGMHIKLFSYANSREFACGDPILGYKVCYYF